MILSHRIRLDLTVKQETYMRKACGVARFAYNWALTEWKRQYEAGDKPDINKIDAKWNAIRKTEFSWSYEVTKCASQQAILNLNKAFNNFFSGKAKYPKYKKKGIHDSFYVANNSFTIKNTKLRLPIIGWINIKEKLKLTGKILSATINRIAGKWYVSIAVEADYSLPQAPNKSVGIDLGIKTLATLSEGTNYANPRALSRFEKKIKKRQRKFSKQRHRALALGIKHSKRQTKNRLKLSRLHARVSEIRKDAIHKMTTEITSKYRTVCIENLNVKGMTKNHSLAKAVSDVSFGEIVRQLEYKSKIRDGNIVKVDRFFPSSKTCSECGIIREKLPLDKRQWQCDDCGTQHDRDLNAAINILNEGMRLGRGTSKASSGIACKTRLVRGQQSGKNREPKSARPL